MTTEERKMNDTALMYVTEDELRAAKLLRMLLPYGDKLTDLNALALRAYSNLHGLDPVNGECYFLVREKDGKREELGCYPGIKGLRKKSKDQLYQIDRQAWYTVDYEAVDPSLIGYDEKKAATVQFCIQATLRDSISMGRYIIQSVQMHTAGFDKAEIRAALGPEPKWVGYGVVLKNEWWLKQPPLVTAKKRAEADATKQRFDLPFVDDYLADDVPEVDIKINGADQLPSGEKPKRSQANILADLGFAPPEEKVTEPEVETTPEIVYPKDLVDVKTQKGRRYVDLTDDEISQYIEDITNELQKPGLNQNKQGDLSMRAQVMRDILALRHPMPTDEQMELEV